MKVRVINVVIVEVGASYCKITTQLPEKMTNECAVHILEKAIRDIKAKEIADSRELQR